MLTKKRILCQTLTGEREEEFVDDEHRLAYENEKRVVHRFDKEKGRYVQEITTRKDLMDRKE